METLCPPRSGGLKPSQETLATIRRGLEAKVTRQGIDVLERLGVWIASEHLPEWLGGASGVTWPPPDATAAIEMAGST